MRKKSAVTTQNLQSIETFLTLELSQYQKSGTLAAVFPLVSLWLQAGLQPAWKYPVFVLANVTSQSLA